LTIKNLSGIFKQSFVLTGVPGLPPSAAAAEHPRVGHDPARHGLPVGRLQSVSSVVSSLGIEIIRLEVE
jgi:hypothetical protein